MSAREAGLTARSAGLGSGNGEGVSPESIGRRRAEHALDEAWDRSGREVEWALMKLAAQPEPRVYLPTSGLKPGSPLWHPL